MRNKVKDFNFKNANILEPLARFHHIQLLQKYFQIDVFGGFIFLISVQFLSVYPSYPQVPAPSNGQVVSIIVAY